MFEPFSHKVFELFGVKGASDVILTIFQHSVGLISCGNPTVWQSFVKAAFLVSVELASSECLVANHAQVESFPLFSHSADQLKSCLHLFPLAVDFIGSLGLAGGHNSTQPIRVVI